MGLSLALFGALWFAQRLTRPFVGYLADMHGVSAALNLLGVWSVLAFAVVMLPLIRAAKLLEANKVGVQRS